MQLSNSLLMHDMQFNIFTSAARFNDSKLYCSIALFSHTSYTALHLYTQMTSLWSFRNITHSDNNYSATILSASFFSAFPEKSIISLCDLYPTGFLFT